VLLYEQNLQYFIFITEYSKCDVHQCLMTRGFKHNCNHVSYAKTLKIKNIYM